MSVICVSSDSEDLNLLDDTVTYSKPLNIEDDVFVADWYDEPYPPVHCASEVNEKDKDVITFPNEEEQCILKPSQPESNEPKSTKNQLATSVYDISDASSSDGDDKNLKLTSLLTCQMKGNIEKKSHTKGKPAVKTMNKQQKVDKEKLREEKKAELQKQKAQKAALMENQRNLKPEENIKFLKVHIDSDIINSPLGGNLIALLQQHTIQYVVESQLKTSTITWSKRRTIKEVDNHGQIFDVIEHNEEKQLIYVIEWEKAVNLIYNGDLLNDVETVKSVYPDKKLTLIIYGLEKYFDFLKSKKKTEGKLKKLTEVEKGYNDAPVITKDQLEFALTDLQLFGRHNVRLMESPEQFSCFLFNITKSLSQLDYKLDKQKRQEEDFDWFAKGDSNGTVKIDKNGKGLINLWQQQICQFRSVGVETAEAIITSYNSPLSLMTQYKKCKSSAEAELLLQDIQIRRDFGLVSSTRRVGPQLSRIIHKFFTSDDPDEEL